MSRREEELFAAARAWNPVERSMLARVERRLDERSRRRTLGWIPAAVTIAIAAACLMLIAQPSPPPELAGGVPEHPAVKPRQTSYATRASAAKPAPAPAVKARVERIVVEQPPALGPELAVETPPARASSVAPPKRYLPRAIAEFQQVDWRRLEQSDEVPAYVRAIIHRRDRRALLAALDRIDVDRELRLVRGELRAGDDRCSEATADFDAILSDRASPELHPRAAEGLDRCR